MKVIKFSNDHVFTNNIEELKEKKEFNKASQGKWYHLQRVYIVKSLSTNDYALVTLNIFERFLHSVFRVNFFNKKYFEGKKISVILPQGVQKILQVKEKILSDNTKTVIDPIVSSLAKFDNQSVTGQVHGIYITTNETNLAATDDFLKTHPSRERTIHIGCAGWHNFDIMCKRKSGYGLIVDFNPKNAAFIKKTLELVKASDSREVFKSAMIAYLNSLSGKEKDLFFHADQKELPTTKIEKELLREGSWLHSDESYSFIRSLASKEQIVAITENITNYKNFAKIRAFLDLNHLSIDTFYLSNICNFMRTNEDQAAFLKSVTHMVDNQTMFISCPKLKQPNGTPPIILQQRPILGNEILEADFDHSRLFELPA